MFPEYEEKMVTSEFWLLAGAVEVLLVGFMVALDSDMTLVVGNC